MNAATSEVILREQSQPLKLFRWSLTITEGEFTQTVVVTAPTEGKARELAMDCTTLSREHAIIAGCTIAPSWANPSDDATTLTDHKASRYAAMADAQGLYAYELITEQGRAIFIASPDDCKEIERSLTRLKKKTKQLERALNGCVVAMKNSRAAKNCNLINKAAALAGNALYNGGA